MRYKLLGRSGLRVSELCRGTMQFINRVEGLGFAFGDATRGSTTTADRAGRLRLDHA